MRLIKALQIPLTPERVYGLDILRAFAIFFVVAEHGGAYLEGKLQYYYYLAFVHDGVSMFFVLSGFLIGTILIKTLEKEEATVPTLGNFWIRRWIRTIPPYFLILTILVIIDKPFDPNYDRSLTKHYYIFNQNFSTPQPNFFPESWSLSVEEWFYLLVPSLVFVLTGLFRVNHKIVIPVIAFCVIAAITFVRVYRVGHTDFHGDHYMWDFYLRKQVITRLDTPMFGIIGAYIAWYLKKAWLRFRYPLLIAGIGMLVLHRYSFLWLQSNPFFYMYDCVFSFSLVSLATLFLLPCLSEIKHGKGFLYKVITYTSIISYSMYLLNLSVVQQLILPQIINTPPWACYILFWILTYILSHIMYKYFEKPVMDLRQKIKSRRTNVT
jgi:peptidoglycan/LPS O-acetylase OafA/YrhL